MATSSASQGPPIAETRALVRRWADWAGGSQPADLGEGLIAIREAGIDALEAVFAENLPRFDRSGEYAADGALGSSPGCAGNASSPAPPPVNG